VMVVLGVVVVVGTVWVDEGCFPNVRKTTRNKPLLRSVVQFI